MSMKCEAEFCVGDAVKHAANCESPPLFPAGCGTIEKVTPWNTADGYSYTVMCAATQKCLPVNFKASELECDDTP